MTTKRYAAETSVRSGKSREEIDTLLRQWGCHQIIWADDFREGRVELRFIWEHEGVEYVARFPLSIPTDDDIRKIARHSTTHRFLQAKFDRIAQRRGWAEHRQLLLWLKATFNAVEAGIIEAACVFLPFIEDAEGVTFSERVLPNLPKILERGGVSNLLNPGEPTQ